VQTNRTFFSALLFLVFFPTLLMAAPCPSQTGSVMDFARSLSEGTVKNLEASLEEYHKLHGIDIAVVIVDPTKEMKNCPDLADNYARDLLAAWGVGTHAGDTGGVVLVVFTDNELPIIAHTPSLDAIFERRTIDVTVQKEVGKSLMGYDGERRRSPAIAGLATVMNELRFFTADEPTKTARARP